MSWGGPGFVLAIVGMSMAAWVITTWLRVKHGYPVENEWGGMVAKGYDGMDEEYPNAVRKIELLTGENTRMVGQITRLEERIAVLERIVTDPAERTARDIDALR